MPRLQPPPGYYTATEVKKILNVSDAMVRTHVEKGKIAYLVPPGRKQGFYRKKDVDRLVHEIENFFALNEEVEKAEFVIATIEDIPACVKLNREIFAIEAQEDDAVIIKKWSEWVQKNPEIVYVLKRGTELVGISTILPFKPESRRFEDMISSDTSILLGDVNIFAEDIESFTPENRIQLYIAEIGIKPSLDKTLRRKYGAKLIAKLTDKIIDLGKRGVIIESMTSVGATKSGEKLLRYFGFGQVEFARSDTKLFTLDMSKSGAPMPHAYREALTGYQKT